MNPFKSEPFYTYQHGVYEQQTDFGRPTFEKNGKQYFIYDNPFATQNPFTKRDPKIFENDFKLSGAHPPIDFGNRNGTLGMNDRPQNQKFFGGNGREDDPRYTTRSAFKFDYNSNCNYDYNYDCQNHSDVGNFENCSYKNSGFGRVRGDGEYRDNQFFKEDSSMFY